jgi:hypothetical protein
MSIITKTKPTKKIIILDKTKPIKTLLHRGETGQHGGKEKSYFLIGNNIDESRLSIPKSVQLCETSWVFCRWLDVRCADPYIFFPITNEKNSWAESLTDIVNDVLKRHTRTAVLFSNDSINSRYVFKSLKETADETDQALDSMPDMYQAFYKASMSMWINHYEHPLLLELGSRRKTRTIEEE